MLKGPTIPEMSTVESAPLILTAGKLSQSLFQSRDSYGTVLDNINDVYEMSFTSSKSVGSFNVIAIYLQNGLYQA